MNFAAIDFAKQCCDADEYLDMGYQCAQTGYCYNSLRPIGDTLWFGIPYALNTSIDVLFYLHMALLALVSASVFFLLKKIVSTFIFIMILGVLIWPTLFFTLSDTPATLFFIEGIVLAMIGINRNSALLFFAAGILLGVSALFRTAYFIPLCISAAVLLAYLLGQSITKKIPQVKSILILVFLLPLSFQFLNTWSHMREWSFVTAGQSSRMMNLHLNSTVVGYDTVLPQTGAPWSSDCAPKQGLLPSLQSADIPSFACILKNRLTFYLGSYASSTYLGGDVRNFLDNYLASKKPDNFFQSKSLIPLPPGQYRYSALLISADKNQHGTILVQLENYSLSQVTINNPDSLLVNAIKTESIPLTDTPQKYTANIVNPSVGYIVVNMNGAEKFSVQEPALEFSASAQGYTQQQTSRNVIGENTNHPIGNRIFSNLYLATNIIIIAAAIFYIFTAFLTTQSPMLFFIAALLFSTLAQCLFIIPEQRYIQAVLGSFWLMSILLVSNRSQHT